MGGWLGRVGSRIDGARGGLAVDVTLYGLSALFAWSTGSASTLAPHRAWGAVAAFGYAAAALVALVQLVLNAAQPAARAVVAALAWGTTALVPLVYQAVARAGGRTDRAQEEVLVIEDGAKRLLETGSPYLDRAAIAALPEGERLLAYLPYQPGMAVFGIPRALNAPAPADAAAWWTDARVWFALATAAALAGALVLLRRAGARPPALVRALQVATVLPVCALTLATGGDDLPVLALCLLALALAASGRLGWAGVAVGCAGALKLFAWPVAIVLAAYAATVGRGPLTRYAAGALGVPVLTSVPVLVADPGAMVENVLAFPSGRGLVTSPAQSPLPGHLIATSVPGGRAIATAVVLAFGLAFAVWLVRHPPRTAAGASLVCGTGLLAAMLTLPSTRFGYLLYPVAFLVWSAALSVDQRGSIGLAARQDVGRPGRT